MRIVLPMPTLCTSLRILLAEDNQINQRIVLALLEKHGHTVDIASNGVVAVEAVLHADYDIVLMDIQMPELDGVAATKQIRALAEPKCRIPIVAMTANAMSGARAEYLAAGMDAYISKPYEFETLMAIIDRLTATRKPATDLQNAESHIPQINNAGTSGLRP